MTLFGRDALLTAYMTLPFDLTLASGVLRTLARHQGTGDEERSEEQPGRILHEVRRGARADTMNSSTYYGTVDATPLYIIVLAEARRWGLASRGVDDLLPHVRAALEWIRGPGDLDGDGYVEYPARTGRGLRSQGWKDSFDAIQYADGRVAQGPIAVAEVQGYTYRALLDAAELLDLAGDRIEAARARREAEELAARFRRDFWMDACGFPALALDGDKRQVDAVASNAGHLLWTGILSSDQEAAVARRLVSPELFSGWGVRTLAASNHGYKPVSYHAGSVWPHDTAMAVAGLTRAGFAHEAAELAQGLLDAAPHFGYRLPELFAGFDRSPFGFPVGYPTTCSPQAWAAASVLLLLRALLGIDADLPAGRLSLAPWLPSDWLPLEIHGWEMQGWPLGDGRLSVRIGADGTIEPEETPAGLEVTLANQNGSNGRADQVIS